MKKKPTNPLIKQAITFLFILLFALGFILHIRKGRVWKQSPKKFTIGRVDNRLMEDEGVYYFYYVDSIRYSEQAVVPLWALGQFRPQTKFIVCYVEDDPSNSRLFFKYKLEWTHEPSNQSWDSIPAKLLDKKWANKYANEELY